jgi:hypothetical protein
MNGLIVEDKIDMIQEEIDRYSDHEEDEPMKPVHGQEVMKAGKYKNTHNMEYAYTQDKKHLKWVRSNIQPQGSSPEMRRYRLYVEMRDQKKSQRLLSRMEQQRPVAPQPKTHVAAMTTAKAKAKSVEPASSRRREREGEGWSHEMTAMEMDYDEYKTWAFLDELEKEKNQEQQNQMW